MAKKREIRVGTAGWTDPTLTTPGLFYPRNVDTPEERLRYYSTIFPIVEVDSTYYALPSRRNTELWLERTEPGFLFDMKAHALMTGQPTEPRRLPADIRDALPEEIRNQRRIYGADLPDELNEEVWRRFREAVLPLHEAGRFGSVLLQYPRWFFPSSANRAAITAARERLRPLPCAVEFRNGAWLNEKNREQTLNLLQEHQTPLVMVDSPQGLKSSVPPLIAVTSPDLAVVRFHGRRADLWEARNAGVEERFRYLYDTSQLQDWTPRIEEAARGARQVHVIMNNCYANYGVTNALELTDLLRKAAAE